MKMNFITEFFNKQLLGVDLGKRTIKGVKLMKAKDGTVKLVNHFFQDLAATSEQFPEKANRIEALKAALEIHKLSSSYVASTVRDSQVMSFLFDLPQMSDKELSQIVPLEIAEHANIIVEDHNCDYTLSPVLSEKPGMTAIRAYCVKREVVLEQMRVLKEVGLKPQNIESEMMAITAMLKFNDYINPQEVVVVLDLGESHLTSGLIADGCLSLTRTHDVSFGTLNQELHEQCNLTYNSAEKIKLNYDFLLPVEEGNKVSEVLSETYLQIFQSVKDSLDFYKECRESYGRIDRILLVGGASQLSCVSLTLDTIFKIPTVVVNPFRKIDIFTAIDSHSQDEIAQLAPYMGIAVGLALASIPEEDAA